MKKIQPIDDVFIKEDNDEDDIDKIMLNLAKQLKNAKDKQPYFKPEQVKEISKSGNWNLLFYGIGFLCGIVTMIGFYLMYYINR